MPSTYVPPVGPLNAKIAVIGEQPGRNEVTRPYLGPFSGPAGHGLQECMRVAGIPWEDVYRSNVIKDFDAPLSSYIELRSDRSTEVVVTPKGERYIEELRDELLGIAANVIVACGNVALWALCSRTGITAWRGSILSSTLLPGRKVIPTIHPATWTQEKLHANPSAYLNKYLVVLDLKRARAESEFPEIRPSAHKLIIRPTFHEVMSFINDCIYHAAFNRATVDYDIEITKTQELSCIGLAYTPCVAMCIPFIDESGDYFLPEQELQIMLALNKLFSAEYICKRGQNVIFDSHFLLKRYGIRTYNLEDTMVAQGILWPEMRKSLEFITSVWTDIPYYKNDGKIFLSGHGNFEKGWQYNCLDVLSTAIAHPKQITELTQQGNLATYERQRRLIPPLTYMMEHGIRIDVAGMAVAAAAAMSEASMLCDQVSSIVGRPCIISADHATTKNELNISSPQQLQDYFYNHIGLSPYRNRDTRRPTVDETALVRIANKGYKEASLILAIRKLVKKCSTFLDTSQVDSDGRMRCQYNPVGTRFGRISSSASIFGTGCLLPNAEVLTPLGWVQLQYLQQGVPIAQWSSNSTISWCVPKIHTANYDNYMLHWDSTVHRNYYTLDHRVPVISSKGHLSIRPAYEVAELNQWRLPLSGIIKEQGLSLPMVRLLAMIQADGSYEGNGIRLSFKKQHKIDRCRMLLEKYGISYTEQSAREGYTRFYIRTDASRIIQQIMPDKKLGSWILQLDNVSRAELLDELKYWDATIRGRSYEYFTVHRENAEWAATLAHITGHSATMNWTENRSTGSYGEFTAQGLFIVNIKPRDYACLEKADVTKEYYKGPVWCVSTDTTMFLVRYDDRICITGNTNLQNIPHDVLTYFLADPGYVLYSLDMSQIENRIVAYVGNISPMINAFENGIDVHRLTAAMTLTLLGQPRTVETVTSSERQDYGKVPNHALNYGFGYKSYSLAYEVPEALAKRIYNAYHTAYPQLRNKYWAYVERELKDRRALVTPMGRVIPFLGVWSDALLHEAYSAIPQSTCGDHVNERGVEFVYYNTDPLFKSVELLTQIHDSIELQIPLSVPLAQHAHVLIAIKRSLETPLSWHGHDFVVPVDLTIGKCMNKALGVEVKNKDFSEDVPTLTAALADAVEKLDIQSRGPS